MDSKSRYGVAFLDPGFSVISYLFIVDLFKLSGDARNTHCFSSWEILCGWEETEDYRTGMF
jgi:hypothetical protein